MPVCEKGDIHSPDRASQLRDYSGLRFGNITPTDIDGLIEYKNRGYVILELKYIDNEVPLGQELALERLTDDLAKSGKKSLCIIATHNTDNPEERIDAANTAIRKYRYLGKWVIPQKNLFTKDLIQRFINSMEALI